MTLLQIQQSGVFQAFPERRSNESSTHRVGIPHRDKTLKQETPGVRAILSALRNRNTTPDDVPLLIAAHRGIVAPGIPENSIPSILAAINAGCMILEIDVRSTLDGVVVCLHDDGVGRATNVDGKGRENRYDTLTGRGYNPLVKEMMWRGDLEHLHLRDEDGAVT
jgi:glycerophosphoryl diester phosphodiesterase